MARLGVGTHEVSCVDAYFTESQAGKPGITFQFLSDDGDTMDCTRWISDKTKEWVLRDLETLNFTRDKLSSQESLAKIADITRHARCKIVVEEEEYQGERVPKVKWINSVGPSRAGGETISAAWSVLSGRGEPLVSAPRPVKAQAATSQPTRPSSSSQPEPFAPDSSEVPF